MDQLGRLGGTSVALGVLAGVAGTGGAHRVGIDRRAGRPRFRRRAVRVLRMDMDNLCNE